MLVEDIYSSIHLMRQYFCLPIIICGNTAIARGSAALPGAAAAMPEEEKTRLPHSTRRHRNAGLHERVSRNRGVW
jgi:hypothetical protein